ncbi:MAG TPA: type IX secretion system protein PorQ [Bacteroidia bacterium]|nr:type IX secretion system protein PorQ [Bacteroidia bacterium]
MRLRYFTLFILFVSSATGVFAQIGGTSTYDFLELPVSARAAALGGNFVSVRDGDLSLAATNPAFLDSTLNNHAIVGYIPFFDGIDYDYFSISHTIKGFGFLGQSGTFDAGVKYINYGTFTQADFAGNITGQFTAAEYMYNVGYGQPIKDSTIDVGANLKVINSHEAQYTSWGMALDLAGSYISPNRRFFLGMVVQNVGTQFKEYTAGDAEPLPFNVQLGFSIKLAHAPFRIGVTADHLQVWDLTYLDPTDTQTVNQLTGQAVTQSWLASFADKAMRHLTPNLEVVLSKNFMLRFAYNYEMRKELELEGRQGLVGFSGGFGIKIYKFHLNYALTSYYLGAGTSTFSMGLNLDEFYTRKT